MSWIWRVCYKCWNTVTEAYNVLHGANWVVILIYNTERTVFTSFVLLFGIAIWFVCWSLVVCNIVCFCLPTKTRNILIIRSLWVRISWWYKQFLVHTFLHSLTIYFVHSLFPFLVNSFKQSVLCSFFIQSFCFSFIHSFLPSFLHINVYPCVPSFPSSFGSSFIYLCICVSFAHLWDRVYTYI